MLIRSSDAGCVAVIAAAGQRLFGGAATHIGASPSVLYIVTLPPFQRLVDAHWRDVARLAHALAGPVDGDDVAQQAWVQALAAYPTLRSADNLRGWLLTITSRCATDAHRARARRAVPVDDVAGEAFDEAGGGGAVDAIAAWSTFDGPVWAAVRDLPERQRTAMALRYVADYDHAGIAAALGTTPGASRRLVSDALAQLRSALPTREELS
jgi:RNA polymerase sigma factor (sigma-70 family)